MTFYFDEAATGRDSSFQHSRAMAQSSWARTTSARTFDSGAAMSRSEGPSEFLAKSRTRLRNVRRLHAAARTSGEFSPIPAVKTRTDVESVERGGHESYACCKTVDEDFEREFGAGVALFHRGDDLAHIPGNSGDAEEAGFFVEEIVELLAGERTFAHEIGKDAGTDGARPGSHHETFERSEAHGGVYAAAIANGGEGTAVSQVARYDFQ